MSDPLDRLLDSLDLTQSAHKPAPPPAFMRAVGRRHLRRVLSRVIACCIGLPIAFGILSLLIPPAQQHPLNPPEPSRGLPDTQLALSNMSVLALTRANIDAAPEHLVLPESPALTIQPAVRLGVGLDPTQIETWIGQ